MAKSAHTKIEAGLLDALAFVRGEPSRARSRTVRVPNWTKTQQKIAAAGSICFPCARDNGGVWPKGHCATCGPSTCMVCGQEADCADRSDWDFPWLRLRPMEREI